MECLMNYGMRFVTLYRRQGSRPSPWKRKAQWLSGEVLQIAVKRREAKSKGAKQRYKHLNAELGMDREAWRAVTHGVSKSQT